MKLPKCERKSTRNRLLIDLQLECTFVCFIYPVSYNEDKNSIVLHRFVVVLF